MHRVILIIFIGAFWGCSGPSEPLPFQEVAIQEVYTDSVSIRALEVMPGSVGFAGSDGLFGSMDLQNLKVRTQRMAYLEIFPEFRAVAHTSTDFFMLSAGDPALLYKTGDSGTMELVYQESGPGVFYDAMAFWDDANGIAIGDAMGGCLSILISRDGGKHWSKIPCNRLPEALPGEGAFAASDTNIAIWGDFCWVASNKGRIYFSADKGETWKVRQSPVTSATDSFGLYSLAFYDAETGYAAGGDYTNPKGNLSNKISTSDGGKTWMLRAQGETPGYLSCVQFVPGRGGRELVGVSFNGIYYSKDSGQTWNLLDPEGFYSIRFTSDSVAVASGKGRIAKLRFK
ncbi:WD40/YVTN/BNR-like repeat-containing protein [Robiginitalea sp.]|uniref:WD40/YVTN/BNR-like repeat-containing protein n=1 Tax=Robiginitalea sp. TaxID=1902411 RepID=UPI003C415657